MSWTAVEGQFGILKVINVYVFVRNLISNGIKSLKHGISIFVKRGLLVTGSSQSYFPLEMIHKSYRYL